ncbi:MAG: hypothetical protein JXX29_11195, partial [Deltaproteobacteria bacterium]|nr:hypothetical protein [Deltaproteobacteria bacterium]MBN2672236.1 hypothetical protein [Deltaproteobacteria bacterium]
LFRILLHQSAVWGILLVVNTYPSYGNADCQQSHAQHVSAAPSARQTAEQSTGKIGEYIEIVVLKPWGDELTFDDIQSVLQGADEPNVSYILIEQKKPGNTTDENGDSLRAQAVNSVQSYGADAVIWFSVGPPFTVHLVSFKEHGFHYDRELKKNRQQSLEQASLVIRGWLDGLLSLSYSNSSDAQRSSDESLRRDAASLLGSEESRNKAIEEKQLDAPGRVWLETGISATSSRKFTMGLIASLAVQNKRYWAAFAGLAVFWPVTVHKRVYSDEPVVDDGTLVELTIFKIPVFMGVRKLFPLGRFLLGIYVALELDTVMQQLAWENYSRNSTSVHPSLLTALSMAWRLTPRLAFFSELWGRAVLRSPKYEANVYGEPEVIFSPWAWQPYINVGLRMLLF